MEYKTKSGFLGKLVYLIILIILIVIIVKLYNIYKINNFNEFIKIEAIPYTSKFTRDNEVKYSDKSSYKIQSNVMNDAMFYKTIKVEPNKPYKVTCMVKTENVKTSKENSNAGAHISIENTVEKSESIKGTTDWQKLEFIFNSKNRTSVNIGFRLGGYDDNCTGTVWFSDFKIEVGTQGQNTNWNFACFVFKNTDVSVETGGKINNVKLSMDSTDVSDIRQNMSRFKTSCQRLSNDQMTVQYDFITIDTPITSLSYDKENGYYVAPQDVKDIIKPYLEKEIYDHIFVALRLGDAMHQSDIQVNDWIGLGGMDLLGIGFSNIRLPNSDKSYIYKYDSRINTFPEEVFIHEFLHSLERNAKEYGYDRPELHDNEKYGYSNKKLIGLKEWYQDYMTCNIKTSEGKKIGLNSEIYRLKPNNENNFKFAYKLDEFNEPSNVLEEIKILINNVLRNITIKEGNVIQ